MDELLRPEEISPEDWVATPAGVRTFILTLVPLREQVALLEARVHDAAVLRAGVAPLEHRLLEFFDEQSLAADLGKGRIENLVAGRLHDQQLDLQTRMMPEEAVANVLRLPDREAATASGNADDLSGWGWRAHRLGSSGVQLKTGRMLRCRVMRSNQKAQAP